MTDLAIIGYGAIGQYLTARLRDEADTRLRAVVVRPQRVDEVRAELGEGMSVVSSIDEVTDTVDLFVECAGHDGLRAHGPAVLERGGELLVVSVGALADRALHRNLTEHAEASAGRMTIVPGAVAGIDGLAAARIGGLDTVRYTSRKPPVAWRGTVAEESVDLDAITGETELFAGPADEAARLYPKNANVAATIALAGVGFDRTVVRVLADPNAGGNVHEVEASGAFGEMSLRLRGQPLAENPKTSSLTAYSILRAIANRAGSVEI